MVEPGVDAAGAEGVGEGEDGGFVDGGVADEDAHVGWTGADLLGVADLVVGRLEGSVGRLESRVAGLLPIWAIFRDWFWPRCIRRPQTFHTRRGPARNPA